MTQTAQALGVRGWVRNRGDGTVEALCIGDAPAVEALAAWARRGPPQAGVERVEIVEAREPLTPATGFEQRPTI